MEKTFNTLDKLKEILEGSFTIPVFRKIVVDKDKIMEILYELEKSIPEEFLEAKRILENREKIIKSTNIEAEHILEQAKDKAQLLISQDNITLEAQRKAEEIVKDAEEESEEIKKEMKLYVDELLNKIEELLKKEMELIEKCRSAL